MEDRVVLANRADGLGARLNAVLNAMRLADLLGVGFTFTWPLSGLVPRDLTHAIVPAEEFFAADFLAEHWMPERSVESGFASLVGRRIGRESLHEQLRAAERGLVAPNSPLAPRVDPKAVPEVTRGFSAEFARIGFHPRIHEAVRAAHDVDLTPGSVGIHLRGGDHIFGRFRVVNRFWDKTIPAPIARELILRATADGEDVIVFGQDEDLLSELCSSTGAVDARAKRPASLANRSAEAMFDLVLMSRCRRILAGDSGFAVQAASIGDKRVEFHVDLIRPEESLEITRTDLELRGDRYLPRQRAFAWWVAYYRVRDDIPFEDAAELISSAIVDDPDNPRSRLRLAALSYRAGDIARGDEVLVDALTEDVEAGRENLQSVLVFSRKPGGKFDSQEILPDIEGAADLGPGPALIYRAAIRAQRGDVEGAAKDAAAFRTFAAVDRRLAGLTGLTGLTAATMAERLGSL